MAESLMYEFENDYWHNNRFVLGIDEAGRGPICGPLVVCGVCFPIAYKDDEINDSKKLSEKKRKELFLRIIKEAKTYFIKIVSAKEIDRINIYRATQKAMQEIANDFDGVVLTDCMPLIDVEYHSLVKGDSRSISIAAASILAKVIRDHIMNGYDILYPAYGFKRHKGYPTKLHLEKLDEYGILPIYRFSYKPVIISKQLKLF